MWHNVPDHKVSQARWNGGGAGAMLRCAAETGNIVIAKLLLKLGLPIFSADEKWNTALILAVKAASETAAAEPRDRKKFDAQIDMLKVCPPLAEGCSAPPSRG
eukprot:427694-Prymnesium_polylepis.1